MEASDLLSIVIPTLNEGAGIGSLVDRLSGGADREVIVADGGSVDGTAGIAGDRGAAVILSPPGRARQMNSGAGRHGGTLSSSFTPTRSRPMDTTMTSDWP